MKKILRALPFCLMLCACQKTTTPSPRNPPNPPPVTDPGSGAVKFSSVMPARIYTGDTITITGSGFSEDITKDTVTLGYMIQGEFKVVARTGKKIRPDNYNIMTILSASSTEIKIATDSAMDLNIGFINLPSPNAAIRIAVGNDHLQTDTIAHFRRWPFIFDYETKNPYPNNNPAGCGYVIAYTYTNDSLFLSGSGMYPPCKFYIDNREVAMDFYNEPNPDHFNQQHGRGKLPIDFFGLVNPTTCDETRTLTIKIVNEDGRMKEGKFPFWPGPAYKIASMKWDSTKYHLSTGHLATLSIQGYCLRNDMYITVAGRDLDNNTSFSKEYHLDGVNNFPSGYTYGLDLAGLPVPSGKNGFRYTYNIKIGVAGIYYGFYSDAFTVFN